MNNILFDELQGRIHLLPFTYTRPISDIRIGILKIHEKWAYYLKDNPSFLTAPYLAEKFPLRISKRNLYINAQCLPHPKLAKEIKKLNKNQALLDGDRLVAIRLNQAVVTDNELFNILESDDIKIKKLKTNASWLDNTWDIFQKNREEIQLDFELITEGRQSEELLDPHTIVYGEENIFIEEGAQIKAAILNAEDAPIYIGKNAVVHEGAIIKGAFALGEGAHVNMGAKIKGDTTIGPYCKVGGEVSNSVIFGFSNKGHDGFIGNTVLGEWCNLGADTNTSNLKNNYGPVKLWDFSTDAYTSTGQQFCGLMMGDHSKTGINTMFNTGTVVGVSANVFGGDFPDKFIPSFAWGNEGTSFQLDKAFEVAERVMSRRKQELTDNDKEILNLIFEKTAPYRR